MVAKSDNYIYVLYQHAKTPVLEFSNSETNSCGGINSWQIPNPANKSTENKFGPIN